MDLYELHVRHALTWYPHLLGTFTGRSIMKAVANNLKNITLETGGKSPLLVFDDCDLDQAVKWSHMGIMGTPSQLRDVYLLYRD